MIGSAVVPPVHLGAFHHLGNKLYSYADDFTLVAVVPSPGEIVAVTEFQNRDLILVGVIC